MFFFLTERRVAMWQSVPPLYKGQERAILPDCQTPTLASPILQICHTPRLQVCQTAKLPDCQIATLPLPSLSRRWTLSPLVREGVRFLYIEERDTSPLDREAVCLLFLQARRGPDCQIARQPKWPVCQTGTLTGCQTAIPPDCSSLHCHNGKIPYCKPAILPD